MLDAALQEERRQYTRLEAQKNTMAFNSTTFGEVVNISEGGLRMKCIIHSDDPFTTSLYVGLLSSKGDYFLDNLPCKIVSIKDASPRSPQSNFFIREAGIMFMGLSAEQQEKLALFLQQNTIQES